MAFEHERQGFANLTSLLHYLYVLYSLATIGTQWRSFGWVFPSILIRKDFVWGSDTVSIHLLEVLIVKI